MTLPNNYIGIGFFATITNELSASDLGLSAGTAKVKNLELNQVEIHNTATTATKAEMNTLLNIITSGLGMVLGDVISLLLKSVSFGSFSGRFEDALGDVLDVRKKDPTIFSTGAFAGRIVGDVEIDNCSVTGSVIVENHKNNTGGFVGYVNGMTEYSGLSKALGSLTTFLSRLLNIIPGLGLGDLITILLDKAVPLRNLIPTGYLEPHIKNCTVENLGGTVGQTDTNSSGGFVGSQIGTQIENCAVKNSDYIIEAANYGGGFSGAERDAIVQGTLDGLGVDLLSISQILSDILGSDNFQTESMLKECRIENSTVTVNGGSYLGGFVGAMAASYAIDCDIKGTVSNPLKVSGTGSNIGGFAGEATIGWANSIGKNEADNISLLSVVRQVLTGVLSSDSSANKKLLALVGLVPSAIMGCQTDMSTVNVSGGNSFVGGIVGNGEGILLTESSAAYMNKLTYWENLTEKTERENYLTNLESVISGGNYVGGAAGEVGAVSLAGVLDSAVSAGSFLSFTVSKVTVTGIDTGYTVISNGNYSNENIKGDFVSGGFGMACGGTINRVHLQKVKKIEAANNKAAGFVGAAGPGDLVGAGNELTINLLGLNNVLNISNLLSVGQAIHVTISDSDVTGIETGFTVEAKGSGNTNPGYQYLASGFIAQSNSTEVINCHTYYLKWVKAANVQGYSGGFIGTSQTGGLTDVSDVGGVRSLLSLEGGLLGAISYLIPSYTNCTVTFVDGGYVSADIAGGFAADMQSGKVDNSNDDSNDPKWTKTMQELYDPDAVNATGDLQKQFAVFNIDSVRGQTYGGGFAGKVRSGALAGSSGGISILGNTDLKINISDLLGVINAYVPFVRNAGVYSENGFVVAADEIRSNDSHSGSAGGFAGYMSGAQISYCDVYKLKHTEVTPPDNLESISGTSYFDNTKSKYAVVGGHYAGGYVGNMDIGDAASVGSGLQVFGTGIKLTDVLSALSVVVSTIEHSDVQGAGGGFSVIADKTVNDLKVGMSGGYAGTVCGGHIQNSHCKNFYYIIGEEMAGGYVGNMEPGNVANLMDETNVGLLRGLLGNILNVDSSLASLAEDFVPTIRNSTTSCVPCGGAVRAQAASDSGHQRGCAGGFCGHNEGGHIWGLNTSTWEKENDGNVLGHDFGHNAEGNYIGEQHICTAWRIRSVYGYEYAGGFTGFMESADTADTGNISLLGNLIKVDNLLGALSAVYPTEKNTAVYGPLRNIDIDTWNGWVNYIGRFGGYGAELANEGTASNQTELNQKLLKYIYGLNVVAGRTAHDQEGMPITEGGNAGGYVGYMVSGVISNGQTHDIRHIKAMRSSGGYAGRMKTGGAANFGSTSILGLNLNIGQLVKAVQVFVPTIRSGSVQGWQSGMTVTATGTDLVHNCGYAGGYVGSGYGAQIWGDKGVDNGPSSGCNVINLKFVRGTNAVGGFVGMATAASVVDANTNASNGLLQSILNSLISTPSDLVSVLDATITTVRQVEIITESQTNDSNDKEKRPNNKEFGFIIEDCNGVAPRFAGGFAGSLEASVIGSRKGESRIIVNDLRGVYGQYYAGGFVGLADVGSVASVSSDTSTGGGTSILNGLVAAGNVDVLDIFRTYIYYSEVNGVEEGFIVRASTSAEQGILSETRYSGCAGGFGGGMMNGSVKNSKVTNLNTVSGVNYNGGFIGHMGKNGAADIDSANVANDLLAGLNAGILDIFGTVVNECEVHGIDAGAVIFSDKGPQPIAGGFAGYGDLSQIKNSKVNSLKQVYSDEIAGGFIGKTNMEYLVSTEVDSTLLNIVLRILNILLKILLIPDLESSDLLDTNKLLSLIGVSEIPLGLKLLSDGDLLYVNLLGLKIGVSLVKEQGNGTTGTAIVTIGDSSVELPYTNGAFDTENPEVVINLLKGNTTRVLNCSVTGIDIGYDVYGGGASNIADGTNVNGYAGGFVGYNNEGRLFDNKMIYCDVVRGTSGKIGHFSGVSVLNTVYDHTSDEIERNNEYHIYRSVGEDYKYALTEEGTLIAGSTEDTGTSVKYNRFDMMHYDSNSPIKKYDDWKDAYISQTNQVTANSQRIGVYKSDAKAVLMSDTPTKENSRSLIPETAERQDPCDENIHITIQKIWEDFDNERGNRPDTIKVRLIQHWLNPDGTVYKEGGQPKTVFYTDTNVIPDADSNGWFTLTRSEHERQDSSTWVRVIEGLPSGQYTTDSLTGMKTAVYYYYYTVEEQKINDYTAVIKYHDSNTAATIANSHGISVFKTDENENGLSGAVFDLYYQETTTPPAYTFNEPVIPPTRIVTVNIPDKPSHPGLEPVTATTTVTTYTYNYPVSPTLPNAEEQDWILPRSDNDYIYFRDYNSGTAGEHDKRSFTADNGSNNPKAPQNANRSWLETNLKDNEQTQHLEIDYTHNYWYAAQFSGSGKQDVQYAIWERFVDRYSGQDTVVWKIQPPDGYNKVRFCLYDGDNCIRTTEQITFKLGEIYHKTNWGGMYKYENGNHCYFNVPLNDESHENWAKYRTTANSSDADKRMTGSTMEQAIRYTPTEQKVIFHCNSNQVWHNIHIEFFGADGTTPVGQKFPGYMMEPYSYAGDNYRVGNYLTYELTIPKEAKYFRVNNGVKTSVYAYRSAITKLYGTEKNGTKNYYNYFSINGTDSGVDVSNSSIFTLGHWPGIPSSDNLNKTYSDKPVDSDYDYIYFEAPSNWGTHIYAYFYGGGNLREDNWQRACYSIWPGVAATATEYTTTNSETGHSDIYKYPTENGTTLNPESTYTDKNNLTVYKFRVPKGERKNYSKVIFNNGLKSQLASGISPHETGVISYHRGYLYTASGSSKLHNETTSTTSYEQRGDHLYIKNSAGWDDIHIKFYNSSGSHILQTGEGYVMDYSGKQNEIEYFKIAIPKNAAKFSLSTGKTYSDDSNTSINTRKTTGKYDILRYAPTETDTSKSDYTKCNMVFDLTENGNTGILTKTYPEFEQISHTQTYSDTQTPPSPDLISNSPRGDYIYIKDTADVMETQTPTFSFISANGTALSSPEVLKLAKDGNNHRWYRVGIPTDAAKFTVNNGSNEYIIYPKSTSSTNQKNVTPGNMYYETESTTTLSLLWPTFTFDEDDLADERFECGQRGDNLYIVVGESENSSWTGMKVTFYDENNTAIENTDGDTEISAKSLGKLTAPPTGQALIDGSTTDNADAQGCWYRVAIPNDAITFTIADTDETKTVPKNEIFEKRDKISRYSNNYTLGDMQYRINGTSTKLIYPVFTEVENRTLEISDGQTIDSESGLTRADISKVSDYADYDGAAATTQNDTMSILPVLHETDTNTITYEWGGGTVVPVIYFDDTFTNWGSDIKIHLFAGTNNTAWPGKAMTSEGNHIWSFPLKGTDNGTAYDYSSCTKVVFNKNGTAKTPDISLPAQISANNYKCVPQAALNSRTVVYFSPQDVTNNRIAYFYNDNDDLVSYASNQNPPGLMNEGGGVGPNNKRSYKATIPDGAKKVKFGASNGNADILNDYTWTDVLTIDTIPAGKGVMMTGTGETGTVSYYDLNEYGLNDGSVNYSNWQDLGSAGSGSSSQSAVYQPEDRYGYINAAASDSDYTYKNTGGSYQSSSDNFITVATDMTDPYIMFYSDDNGTTTIGGSDMAANGISLVKAKISGDTSATDNTSPFKIRLPKNARSFKIGNGASGLQGNKISLYENLNVNSADGTIRTTGDEPYIQITNYHHAGTTFTVDNNGNVTAKELRKEKSFPTQNITDPLNPRTDNDYIYFTDAGNHFANGTVYAYYYGGADGEYTPWPGIMASTSNNAPLVYTDNDENKVYMFQLPKVSDGTYPYVIFNNGSSDSTHNITQKIDIMEISHDSANNIVYSYTAGGNNYRTDAPDTSHIQHYGKYNSSYVQAYPTVHYVKESAPTEYYSSNKMIYIINNGTHQLDNTSDRLKFDDMHIIFYDKDMNTLISSSSSGYKPDKLMNNNSPVNYTDSAGTAGQGNVYRISVPNDVVYFRITNGSKDGDTNQYMRQSEMKPVTANGLYRFVPSAENILDYIQENTFSGDDIEKLHFLLELVNKIDDEELPEGETYDVKLATVVTGADGKQEKIIWLKLNDEENDVDKQYLDHELFDIWNEENNPDAKATEVRVIVDANKCYWKEISAPAGYKLQKEKIPVTSVTTKVIDERLPGQIILKKTAKEKVGTNDIGAAIEGAKFKLVKVNNDNTLGNCVPLAKRKNKFEYEYYDPTQSNTVNVMTASEEYETNNGSLVRYNVMTDDTPPVYDISKALTTNAGGKLKIDNLPCGDYCLEEVQAPKGYSHTDSSTGENRKIYFSVGNNTIIKNIKCSDEMNEAYIRLFEHIDEYRPDEWGNPTFIFKIKQTGYYEWQEPEEVGGEPEWELTSATNGKEISVALTVDENGKWPEGLTSHSDPDYDYNNWYEEATKEPEYKGMYHIGEDGKIRLEPGTYEITRIPVSRYEFVENTWKLDSDDDTVYEGPHRTETEKMTVTIPAGKTATVHYYDRVEYYDKFSHEDTKINKFYTIDDTTKKNKTVKGIRIEDYHRKNGDTDENGIMNVKATDLTICKIMSDGSEIKMTDTEKASLTGTNFIVSYKYDSTSGDAESFGHQENANDNDFSYNNSAEDEDEPGKYPSIVIKNVQRYTNGVYTLTAIYTEQTINFTTTFDIVFSQ